VPAVEKALKALFLTQTKGEVPQSHSLIYLASNTSVPKQWYSFLRQLTPKFVDTRYPDAAVDLPSRIYDKENTIGLLEMSGEILTWISKRLEQS
jgi:HEPN domain-containing protein